MNYKNYPKPNNSSKIIVCVVSVIFIALILILFLLSSSVSATTVISETEAPTEEVIEPIVETGLTLPEFTEYIEETTPGLINETEPLIDNNSEEFETVYKDNNYNPNTWDTYVGRFKIHSVGVDVGCYASNSQATVDATDSAAYYYGQGHIIIADHKNHGFEAIKSCSSGTKAYLSTSQGTKTYTCVGKIKGHNTGYGITDSSGNSLSTLYQGALVCYTCNENWQNITIVFFEPDDGYNIYVDDEGNLNEFEDLEDEIWHNNYYFCDELGKEHKWGEWSIEWGADDGSFAWMSRPCQRCPEEDWDCFYYDVDNDNEESFDEDIDREETTPEEDEKPEETFPPETEETEPPEETEETSPTENWEEETSESLDLTEGEGSAYHTGVSISNET